MTQNRYLVPSPYRAASAWCECEYFFLAPRPLRRFRNLFPLCACAISKRDLSFLLAPDASNLCCIVPFRVRVHKNNENAYFYFISILAISKANVR